MRQHGTEAPGSCALLWEKRPGKFSCAGCGQSLFESKLKFESGTGWPSFNDSIEGAVETSTDPGSRLMRTVPLKLETIGPYESVSREIWTHHLPNWSNGCRRRSYLLPSSWSGIYAFGIRMNDKDQH